MARDREQEEMRFHMFTKWNAPSYYDYPDGQDLLGKLSFTTKVGFLAGLTFGIMDAYTQRPPLLGNKARLMQICTKLIPAMGMTFAFTVTTYYATVLRKKDDEWNYVIGSLAAGSIFTAAAGPKIGVLGTMVMTIIGAYKKTVQLEGRKILSPPPPHYGSSYFKRTLDFSLLPDTYKGNWTKELPTTK